MLAQGYSLDEARKNLYEVIEIQFEEMKELGTLNPSIIHLLDSSLRGNDI
jgi:predicted RNase H-like HicB family nuclease